MSQAQRPNHSLRGLCAFVTNSPASQSRQINYLVRRFWIRLRLRHPRGAVNGFPRGRWGAFDSCAQTRTPSLLHCIAFALRACTPYGVTYANLMFRKRDLSMCLQDTECTYVSGQLTQKGLDVLYIQRGLHHYSILLNCIRNYSVQTQGGFVF